MDFDYTTETITPDSTNILTIAGTGGLEIPAGNTAARPGSPANGLIRYNTDTGQIEGFFSNAWTVANATAYQAMVKKNPGAGEFGSIAAAVASITTSGPTEIWQVYVSPGIYTEPEIVIPPYVYVSGIGQYEIIVQPDSPSHHVFVMSDNTSISFLQIRNAGTGYAAIAAEDVGNFALCHKVSVSNSATGWLISSSTVDSIMYLEYCDTTDGDIGVSISSSNGYNMNVNLENFYVYGNPTHGFEVTGPNSIINMQAFGFEGEDGTGHAVHVQNGASLAAKAGHIYGWDYGAHISDTGAPSEVQFLGVEIQGNTTWDFKTDHPLAFGTLAGTARKDFVDASGSPNFTFSYSDPEENNFVKTGNFFIGQTPDTLTDATDLIGKLPPTGLLSGGDLSIVSGLTVNISAGEGYLLVSGVMTKVTWSAGNITLTANESVYIYINNSGVISQSLSPTDPLTTIPLHRALTGASNLILYGPVYFNLIHYSNRMDSFFKETMGPVFVSGAIVTENSITDRALDVTAGQYYYSIEKVQISNATEIEFLDVYLTSGNLTLSPETQVDNTTYLDLQAGDLVSLTTGYFTKHTLYVAGEGAQQTYFLQHGTAEYATLQEAVDAPIPVPLIDPDGVPHISAIIVQEGQTNIQQLIDIRPLFFGSTGTGTSGVSDHGELTGLLDDDHPQYLLVSGTRAMTGALDLGTNNITNVGTVNGITVQTHGSRHLPNGADPITTATAVGLNVSSTNTTGIANSLARSDHTHQITGFQPLDATLTALAGYNTNGILTQTATDTFTGRSIAGTTDRISITNGNGVSGNPTIDIASTYAGQNTITTIGTITTGTWNGSVISAPFGGTGHSSYAVGDILYADTTTSLSKLADVATGNALISGGVNTAPTWGKIGLSTHVSGTLGVANGGTGLSTTPTNGQLLIGNGSGYSLATLTAGTGISISNGSGTVTVNATNNGTVTSVGLSLPSIFSVSGSPVTTSGTLTGTLANQTANTFFVGPSSGGPAAPTFRTVGIDELSDVVITSPSTNQVIAYNGTNWVNTGAVGSNATGTIGVSPSGGGTAWSLVSGNLYTADFVHNLGTTNLTITVYDTNDNSVVTAQNVSTPNNNTITVTAIGNTKTLKVVAVANGQSIVAGGSTPSSVITAYEGVTVSTAATKLNFIGAGVGLVDAGAGTTNITIGQRYTYFAAALDTPVNSDFAVNSLAPMIADPTYISLNVRSFSNSVEQGVATLISIPTGATKVTFKIRGRAQTAPGVASVVQPRIYYRLLPNNSAVGSWSAAQELANISIPTNANFQYGQQTVNLSTLGMTAGNMYQIELTRRVTGVTGTNLAAAFLLAEFTLEFA